jgi:hypothetical protein
MKGTTWVITLALFIASMMVFSSGYSTVMTYFATPTLAGLVSIMGHLIALLALIATLGFIMYATERKAGNVKVKNHLFERLLGYAPDAPLPSQAQQTQPQEVRK